jgi:formylglycine-generating enzyme required for sulfatase activity
VNVNWKEATLYAAWLGKLRGEVCRLPTEAEWEYAARATTKTAYWWGNEIGSNNANCRDCGDKSDGTQSSLVGSFKPNLFGLYDTQGNVWEWTCSAWQDEFDGSEKACVEPNSSVARVVRGGSWDGVAVFARSAARFNFDPVGRNVNVGLRVLCASPIE